LSWVYAAFGQIGIVQALFFGLKAAVLAIVLEAVLRVGWRALKSPALIVIAGLAFAAVFFFRLPFPLIICAAALAGFVGHTATPAWFKSGGGHRAAANVADAPALIDKEFSRGIPEHVRPSFVRFVKVAVIGGAIWLGPLAALLYGFGPRNVFTVIAAFNCKMAVVTFGGAYAVLAYMAQQAVEHYHWLRPGEMLVGLGFAETTPGPLISVVQFVGTMAAFRHAGPLDPVLAGTLGGVLAMWCTFVPPFIWIFLGGPYIEALSGNRALTAALSAITAAVVGVILNLAVWFALHVLFANLVEVHWSGLIVSIPVFASVSWPALVLSLAAMIATFRFRAGIIPVFAACSLTGALYYFVAGVP
jgi:chromate transporter